jgi:cell division protein FtsQ
MKKALQYLVVSGLAALLVVVLVAMNLLDASQRRLRTVEQLEVTFNGEGSFVTQDEVEAILSRNYGAYIGQRLDSVDLKRIERLLEGKSAILRSEAYVTKDRKLRINILQRQPVLRFRKGSQGWYADAQGYIFPLQEHFTARVPIVDGAVPMTVPEGYKGRLSDEKEVRWLDGMLEMVRFMEHSKIWEDAIVQMHVEQNGDLVLIPREGKERFLFGNPFDCADKFGRLEDYYRYIVPEKGADYYRTVNVKFEKQIVCRK